MKHLRAYNEAVYGVEGVEEFCANYLANLLDDDTYQFSVTSQMSGHRVSPSYFVCLTRNISYDGRPIEGAQDIIQWNDVKDHYIPFYQMLSNEYEISTMSDRSLVSGTPTHGDYEVRTCSVKFEYRKPAKQLWETEAKWFTEEEIINDEVGDLGSYVGVISIFLDNK